MRITDGGRAHGARVVAALLVTLLTRSALADPAPAPGPRVASPVEVAPEPPSDEQARAYRFMLGVAVTGVGAMGLVLGIAYGVRTAIDKGAIGAHCDRAARCDLTGYTLGSEARASSVISTVGLGAGLASAGLGIGLLISGIPRKTGAASAWIAPAPGGLVVGARW